MADEADEQQEYDYYFYGELYEKQTKSSLTRDSKTKQAENPDLREAGSGENLD